MTIERDPNSIIIRFGVGHPRAIIRLWPLAIRWTWPIRRPDGYGVGQDTTQIGFSWPPGPRLPRWREVRP
jgi:hypothetical protein